LDRRLGGPQSRSERGGEEKNSQLPPELESPIIQPVAQRYTTELSQLLMSLSKTRNNREFIYTLIKYSALYTFYST
jgi:hypothetical protein